MLTDDDFQFIDNVSPETLEQVSAVSQADADRMRQLLRQSGFGLLCKLFELARPESEA